MKMKKAIGVIVLVSVAAVILTYLIAPKYTLAVAALMPGTPP